MKMGDLKTSKNVKNKYESAANEQLHQKPEEQLKGQQSITDLNSKLEPKLEQKEIKEQPIQPPSAENRLFNVKSLISSNEGQKGKGKNLYLDNKVLDEIKKIADEQGVSESKVVNDILKHVLFGKV